MNLIKFVLYAAILSLILGAFGRYPFGNSVMAVSLTDLLVGATLVLFLTWTVIRRFQIQLPRIFKSQLLFILVAFISLVLSGVFGGAPYFIRYLLYSLIWLISFNLVKSKVLSFNSLTNIWIKVGTGLALLGLLQLKMFPKLDRLMDYGFDPHQGRLVSTWLDPNLLGAFLVLVLGLVTTRLVSVRTGGNKWNWGIITTLVLAIVLTYSRSAYLMVLVFSLILGLRWKKILLVLAGFLLVVFLIFPRSYQRVVGAVIVDKTVAERLESWQNGLIIAKLNPITGVGFNNLRRMQDRLNLFKVTSSSEVHSGAGVDSGLIFVLATTGVIGLLAYLWIWYQLLKSLWGQKKNSAYIMMALLTALLINGQFINSLFFPGIMLFYFSFLGLEE